MAIIVSIIFVHPMIVAFMVCMPVIRFIIMFVVRIISVMPIIVVFIVCILMVSVIIMIIVCIPVIPVITSGHGSLCVFMSSPFCGSIGER